MPLITARRAGGARPTSGVATSPCSTLPAPLSTRASSACPSSSPGDLHRLNVRATGPDLQADPRSRSGCRAALHDGDELVESWSPDPPAARPRTRLQGCSRWALLRGAAGSRAPRHLRTGRVVRGQPDASAASLVPFPAAIRALADLDGTVAWSPDASGAPPPGDRRYLALLRFGECAGCSSPVSVTATGRSRARRPRCGSIAVKQAPAVTLSEPTALFARCCPTCSSRRAGSASPPQGACVGAGRPGAHSTRLELGPLAFDDRGRLARRPGTARALVSIPWPRFRCGSARSPGRRGSGPCCCCGIRPPHLGRSTRSRSQPPPASAGHDPGGVGRRLLRFDRPVRTGVVRADLVDPSRQVSAWSRPAADGRPGSPFCLHTALVHPGAAWDGLRPHRSAA